jgi:hypothetical protein
MKKLKTIISILILVLSVAIENGIARTSFTRVTFKAKMCAETPIWHDKVFEDENYIFVYRHYGSKNYTPGFFVYGKKQNKWIEIKKLSTENAKLGHSPPMNEVPLSVSWNYEYLKKFDYTDVNLQTTASINFPDKIEYDVASKAYCLKFNSSLDRADSLTIFWMLKEEIEKKLG